MKRGIDTNSQVVYNQGKEYFPLSVFDGYIQPKTVSFNNTFLIWKNLSIIYANIRVWIQDYFVFISNKLIWNFYIKWIQSITT